MRVLYLIAPVLAAGCAAVTRAGEAAGDAAAWLFNPATVEAAEAMAETGAPSFFTDLLRMIGVQEGFIIVLVAYAATARGRAHMMNIGGKFAGLLKSFAGLGGLQHSKKVGADK